MNVSQYENGPDFQTPNEARIAELEDVRDDLLAACKALYATHKQGKGQCCSAADLAIDAISKAEASL